MAKRPYTHRAELRPFSLVIRSILFDADITYTRFISLYGVRYGLKAATLNRYVYQINIPSIPQLWCLAQALADLEETPADDMFMRLAKTLQEIKDKR